MKLYFAGANAELKLFDELGVDRLLIAYPFIKNKNGYKQSYFIDSGAFTAFNTGKQVNLLEYCEWIKKNDVKIYASLDNIRNPEESFDNFIFMKAQGLNPIPVFHYGEDFVWLEKYLKETNYVALGGLVPVKNNILEMKRFLNKCFAMKKGVKYHGFGVNNYEMLKGFPFYSVDATSWHNPMRWGQNFLFEKGKLIRTSHKKRTQDKVLSKDNKLKQAVNAFLEAENYITRLWERRGIKWD